MRVFITGGTGFIGAPLCQALAGHELMVLSRNPNQLKLPFPWHAVQGDLSESESWKPSLASFQPDVCVHLAWSGLPNYSMENNTKNFDAGLVLFENLLAIQCKRVVVTGTCFEYGDLQGCVAEDQVPSSQGLFAAFKSAQRLIGQSMFSRAGISLVWARPFFVYGPNQRATSLIPMTMQSIREGKRPDIRTPNAIQDFIHVNDVANILAHLATSDIPAGTYNVGSGTPVVVRDLVNLIARMLNQPTLYPSISETGTGFWANMDSIRTCIPGLAPRTIEQGVRETVAFLGGFGNCAA